MNDYSTWFWLILIVIFAVGEAATVSLNFIWFAFGALLALLFSVFKAPPALQAVVFVFASALLLFFTRPLAKKFTVSKQERTNFDRIIGQEGIVIEPIDELRSTGQIRILGQVWTARSESGGNIPTGEVVKALRVSGVKVFVEPLERANKADAPESDSDLTDINGGIS